MFKRLNKMFRTDRLILTAAILFCTVGVVRAASFTSSGSGGDVVGPSSSTDNAIARFDSTTGKLLQNSAATVDDTGNVFAGAAVLNASNNSVDAGSARVDIYTVRNGTRVVLSPSSTYGVDIATSGSKVTCDSTNQGSLFYENTDSDSTTATLYMCMESAADTFSWRSVATGG